MFKLFFCFALIVISSCSSHKNHNHNSAHHRFDDAQKWSEIFEAKNRDMWQEPSKIIKIVGIKKDSKVADIGSATGYFSIRIAKVAATGRVWGVDIEPSLVNYLNNRARKEKIKNLFSVLGTFSDPLIPEKVDFVFIVNTYHHISERKQYFENLKKNLKNNGKIIIIDFRKGDLPFGPKDKSKISKTQITNEMKEAGYGLFNDYDFLKYQNLLIFN